jgi:predicted choloylglycine hydrolase
LLNDTDKGIFSKLYSSWAGTIHTSAYFPNEMKAWISLGGNQEPVEFDFAEWLGGKDVQKKRIMGNVDTDIPFVHMDEGADWFRR